MGNWKRFLGDSEKHLNIDLNWMTCWQYLTPWITTVNSQWNGVTKSQKKMNERLFKSNWFKTVGFNLSI